MNRYLVEFDVDDNGIYVYIPAQIYHADDWEHAMEQAMNAYPEADILTIYRLDTVWTSKPTIIHEYPFSEA